MTRDHARLPYIRSNILSAETRLRTARDIAQDAGLTDAAAEITDILNMSRIITGPGGWLDAMEADSD